MIDTKQKITGDLISIHQLPGTEDHDGHIACCTLHVTIRTLNKCIVLYPGINQFCKVEVKLLK